MEIKLSEILNIQNLKGYKLHTAQWNGNVQPLDEYVRDFDNWKGWNCWKPNSNVFNRPYIFSLIDYYPEKNRWLFGGIWKVVERDLSIKRDFAYKIELDPITEPFIGRLLLKYTKTGRNNYRLLEKEFSKMKVSQILKEPYSGAVFCGYENINHRFSAIELIYRNQKLDWKGALSNVKGVYLISDSDNGKRYVGSAYGGMGLWSRWECYMNTGHGFNDGLTEIIKQNGREYARKNFTICLLEYFSMKTDDNFVIARENFWKESLMTRGKYGYNKN